MKSRNELPAEALTPSLPPPAFDPESLFQQFEEAWQSGEAPSITAVLSRLPEGRAVADEERAQLLEELVKIDLEYRWRSPTAAQTNDLSARPQVEDYLRRFPCLGTAGGPTVELISEEYRVRRTWGDRPQAAAYLQRFPLQAERLRQALDRVEVELGGQTLQARSSLRPTRRAPTRLVPDGFEILQELGRGGMGVVYKARQRRPDRVVALKMIVSGERASRLEMDRFRAEIEAAARLQHPNVAQVYEVGQQDGQPFYVMEYVNGGSLAQHLVGTSLEASLVVRLLITLSRAVQAVHEQGILHRDLKPANILLSLSKAQSAENGADIVGALTSDSCTPKISDFGLARRTESAGLTQTGDVLGTPSYLAPEQAEGRTRDLSPATDVYGLGAILYELLTGRPPFRGATMLETLEQVRYRDPLPPRRIQSTVPRDVEIICLKCLHKDPRQRYARATDLADDLERYRSHQPIQARPASRRERILKWALRHPTSATVSVVVALALVVALCGGIIYTVNLRRAEAETRLQRERSTRNYEKALQAVEQMLVTMGAQRLEGVPGTEQMREEALTQAIHLYEELQAEQVEPDPDLYARKAYALSYLGHLQHTMNRLDEAEKTSRRAVELLESLPAEHFSTFSSRRQAAIGQYALARVLVTRGNRVEAKKRLHEARERLEQLAAEGDESSPILVIYCHASLAQVESELTERLRTYRRALYLSEALQDDKPNDWSAANVLGESLYNLATSEQMAGHGDEAEKLNRRCLSLMEPLAARVPRLSQEHSWRFGSRTILVHCYNSLGLLLEGRGRKEEAEALFRKAVTLSEGTAGLYPQFECQEEWAQSSTNLATFYPRNNRLPDAETLYRKAVAIRESLIQEQSGNPLTLVETYSNLSCVLGGSRSEEALALLTKGRALLEPFYRKEPKSTRCAIALASLCSNQGGLLRNLGKADEALACQDRAVEVLLAAHHRDPADDFCRAQCITVLGARALTRSSRKEHKLALADWDRQLEVAGADADKYRSWRSMTLADLGKHSQATDDVTKALRHPKLTDDERYLCVCILARCLAAARENAKLSPSEKRAAADRCATSALENLARLHKSGFFKTPAGRDALATDTDLDPLRGRDDFKRWLRAAK